jgi:hypothetical protein
VYVVSRGKAEVAEQEYAPGIWLRSSVLLINNYSNDNAQLSKSISQVSPFAETCLPPSNLLFILLSVYEEDFNRDQKKYLSLLFMLFVYP